MRNLAILAVTTSSLIGITAPETILRGSRLAPSRSGLAFPINRKRPRDKKSTHGSKVDHSCHAKFESPWPAMSSTPMRQRATPVFAPRTISVQDKQHTERATTKKAGNDTRISPRTATSYAQWTRGSW